MAQDVNVENPSDSDKTVPYSRFKEVNEAKNKTEQELQALRAEKGEPTPDQQKEERAKTFLKGLVREQLEAEKEARRASKAKEQKEFEGAVEKVLNINTSVDKETFLKFIEENSDKYGITSVKGAMKLYKDLNQIKDDTVEKTKENLAAKPKLPKSQGSSNVKTDYPDDKNKSYQQIVSEVVKEAEEQGRK